MGGGGGYRGRGGRGGRADRKGRQMDRRSAGRFPNDRSQQKKDGSGKFNYGKEIDDYSNPAPDQTNAETNPTVDDVKPADADASKETEAVPDGEAPKTEEEPVVEREKTEEELEAEREAAYIGLDEYEKIRGRLEDDLNVEVREAQNDETQFACQEMEKQEEEDVFDFGSLKKAASQRGKKKKTKKITRLHLDEFSPFQSTRNTRLLEGFGGGGRGRGRGRGRGFGGRGRGGYNRSYDDGAYSQENAPTQNTDNQQSENTPDQSQAQDQSFPTLPTQ